MTMYDYDIDGNRERKEKTKRARIKNVIFFLMGFATGYLLTIALFAV